MGKPLEGIESLTCVISFTIHSLYLSGKDFVEFMSAMEIGRSFPERRLEKKVCIYLFAKENLNRSEQ
jgi:hypothetical protein